MNKKEDKIKKNGVVTESLPDGFFRVLLEDESEILAHLGGKLRVHRIRVLTGDKVTVEMTPYDPKRGRIIFRNKWKLNHQLRKFVETVKLSAGRDVFMLYAKRILNTNKDKVLN